MIRKLKVLSLTLATVFAMGAMVASAASAAPKFTATAGASISAVAAGAEFSFTGQGVVCKSIFTGIAPAAQFESFGVNVEFKDCKTTGGFDASITGFDQNGQTGKCTFVLYARGPVDLVCPDKHEVTIDFGPCVVHIPGQKGLGAFYYANNGAHVDMDFDVRSIKATHTDGFLCPLGSSGESTSGVFEAEVGAPATAVPSVGAFNWDAS